MTVESYIKALTPDKRAQVLDEMFGDPQTLWEVSFNAWAEMDPYGKMTVTRSVFFGVSAKTREGARLKVLNYFEQIKPSFTPEIREQL